MLRHTVPRGLESARRRRNESLMPRRWLVTLLAVATLLPVPVHAQGGNIRDLLAGKVLQDQSGQTDDLELTDAEFAFAKLRVEELHVGLIVADPATLPADADAERLAVVEAATAARLESAGMIVDRCVVTGDVTAATCMDQLFQDEAAAIITIGDFGDLSAAAQVPIDNRTIVVGVGGSILGPGAVTLAMDTTAAATEQGRAAGRSLAVAPSKRTGNGLVIAGGNPRREDPVRDAGEAGLKATAPKVKVIGRVGPAEVRTITDLAPFLVSPKPIKVLIGQGLLLDQVSATDLDTLPANLRMVAWDCTTSLRELVDAASRIRGCIATDDEAAGEAAANVVLAIKTSRDVPALINIPVYAYRGTVPVGTGAVELGHRFTQAAVPPTADEQAAAAAALAGRQVGIVVPVEPDASEPEPQRIIREELEATITELGASAIICVGAKAKARACVDSLVEQGVAVIVPIATGGDLAAPAAAAIAAGIPVIGVNDLKLGDAGAVYAYVNPERVARLSGRMAGAYADRTWKGEPVDAAVFNDKGASSNDGLANSLERALVQTDSMISPVNRLAAKTQAQAANAVKALLKRYPSVRLIVGRNGPKAAPILIRKQGVNPGLVIFAQECTPDVLAAVDAGVGTGGRIKGCVDRNPTGAGELAGHLLTRLLAGSAVPEINEVQVIPYEPEFRG